MVTEKEARRWIGKNVDLMLSEYISDDPSNPDEVTAIGMFGRLKDIIKKDRIYLVLGNDGIGDEELSIDEIVTIEKGISEEEWKKLGGSSLFN